MALSPKERRERLKDILSANPFLPDRRLARYFDVSPQTIRLDRLALGIPDQRTRTKELAERAYGIVRAMGGEEIVGELVDLDLGKSAISILETTPEMAFERSGITRSQYIFAQADSLAICIVDAENVVTGIANLKFKRQVKVGERLVAKGQVKSDRGDKFSVLVETRSKGELVFRGKFLVFSLDERGSEN